MKYIASIFIISVFSLAIFLYPPVTVAAVSENLVIMQLQTAGAVSGTLNEEVIVLYNLSAADINISNWCLQDSSASNGVTFNDLACTVPVDTQTQLWAASGGYVSFATSEFMTKNPAFTPDFIFSAGIAASGGHMILVDENKQEIDRVSWGTAVQINGILPAIKHTEGKVLSRDSLALQLDTDINLVDFSSRPLLNPIVSGVYEVEIVVDTCLNIPDVQLEVPQGYMVDADGVCIEDFCPNIDELQIVAPEGYEKINGAVDCTLIPLEDAILFITELVANAPSDDKGQEFIEFYNPQKYAVDLEGYRLQVGPGFTKEFVFPHQSIAAGQYLVFEDSVTKIVLPNTTGVELRLVAPAGNIVSESPVYSNANDDASWALVEDQWIYTNQITPGGPNKPYLEPVEDEVTGVTSVQAPCPAGKYRNPETNRCRIIETAVSQLTPCDEDEYRNTDTNRCRKTPVVSSLSSCPEGQERNPETNRCRKVSVLGASLDEIPTVTDVAVENKAGQINWLVIAVALSGTLAYITYEWRRELGQKLVLVKRRFAGFVR